MTSPGSMNTSVEIAVDPATAFRIFTEELDCWWVQGPINFHDSARAYGHRLEPRVGGRIVEVYVEATGEGLELARITAFDAGERIAWKSSLDDVCIEVRFDKSTGGTLVRVEATLPEGGADRGGTSWLRMAPVWLPMWLEKRDRVPREPLRLGRLAIVVRYGKPAQAARWLRDVFGFEPAADVPLAETDPESTWIEFHVGNNPVVLWGGGAATVADTPPSHTPWIFVDDLDAHYARAKAGGAEIVQEIHQHGYRGYEAADLEGHHWTFAQASPRMR